MDISDIHDQPSADQYWAECGPPTAVERHMAIRDTERAIIKAVLVDGDVQPLKGVLRRLLSGGLTEAPVSEP